MTTYQKIQSEYESSHHKMDQDLAKVVAISWTRAVHVVAITGEALCPVVVIFWLNRSIKYTDVGFHLFALT